MYSKFNDAHQEGDDKMKFVFDLDGTICFQGAPVSEKILSCLETLTEHGHEVIFASARPIRDLLPVLNARFHTYPMIGGNGAFVATKGEIIWTKHFDEETVNAIKDIINQYEATYLIDGEWDYAYTGPANHPIVQHVDPKKLAKQVPLEKLKTISKILILTATNIEKAKEDLSQLNVVINMHGNENVIDISPRDINKWKGLQHLGIKEKEYIAFGNDHNDISMFEKAKYAVMIGDYEPLKAYANEIIPLHSQVEENIIDKITKLM